jgi:hypothetical protein
MLKDEDLEITLGRAIGGDIIFVVHKPTGIRRSAGPPLPKRGRMQQEMILEIEAELVQKGLTKHILPERKSKWK